MRSVGWGLSTVELSGSSSEEADVAGVAQTQQAVLDIHRK